MNFNATFVAIASLTLLSCTTPKNYQPKVTNVSFPELNKATSASVGDRMVEQGSSTLMTGITLRQPNNIANRQFSAGFYPQVGEDEKYTYHSFQIGQSYNGMGALTGAMDVETLRASKEKQQLCVMSIMRTLALGMKMCDTEYAFERSERRVVGPNNFQQTLIYSGRVGDRVKIGYREFSGDMARPAFSNEVEYDLSKSDTVTYKGARIQILSADNETIRYKVLSNFIPI